MVRAYTFIEGVMMPYVRGLFLPEVQDVGRAKQYLDILIWIEHLEKADGLCFDLLDHVRIYLNSLQPFVCQIRLWVPKQHVETASWLEAVKVQYQFVDERDATAEIQIKDADKELLTALGTALSIDADCIAVNRREWLPFVDDFETSGVLLTDTSFLIPYAEYFSRGHDVPWSFRSMTWYNPWTTFYQMSEERTFKLANEVLYLANQKNAPREAQETGRTLVQNRLPNLCYTRDRLLFYDIQLLAAKRTGWKRQKFLFEIGYYLTFYYLTLYGVFDHAALFVSHLLQLGLPEKQVGATYKSFLDALEKKSAPLFAVFTDTKNKEFIERIGYLRNLAAHRGTVMPGIVVEALEREPTEEELDADIRADGKDYLIHLLPAGKAQEDVRKMLRSNARMARYEKGKVLEGVALIQTGGKTAFISPHLDTSWNFNRAMTFLNAVFQECFQLLR
jgi:hypothetical protein